MPIGWQEIHDEALRRIQAREWAPGGLIPNETALADEFGCARATVNRALQVLADAGWLDRRRKAGTRVMLSPQRRAQLAIPVIRQEIESRGQSFSHSVLNQEFAPMPAQQRAALSLNIPVRAMHIRTLYLADTRPFAFEDRWVNLDAIPEFRNAPLNDTSANEWLVANAAFAYGTLDYSASAAGQDEALHLGCPAGTPVMVLQRCTFGPEAPVTSIRLTYAPGHHLHLKI